MRRLRSRADLERHWEHVRLMERLPRPGARGGVRLRQAAEAARARTKLRPLKKWDRVSARSFSTYTNPANHVRLVRLLDFVQDGDRVLDVGIGFGYVTGVLHRERRLAHYVGIDLKEPFLEATRSMAGANDLDLSTRVLEVKSALDLTPEWMAPHRPDVVLVLEVLEHIADPAAALRAIADAVPETTTVLFTVPLLGRLEGVWGHVSLFDRRRLEEVCADAGLHIHHVEPLFSTWSLVAASPSPQAPRRIAGISARTPGPSRKLRRAAEGLPDPQYPSYTATQAVIAADVDCRRTEDDAQHVDARGRKIGALCDVQAGPDGARIGGVRVAVTDPVFLRAQLSFTGADHIEAVRVVLRGRAGDVRASWTWDASRRPVTAEPMTHILRAGVSTSRFTTDGAVDGDVATLDVEIRVAAGAHAAFRLHRVAFVGPAPESAASCLPSGTRA